MVWATPHFFWIFVISIVAIVAVQRVIRSYQREKTIRAAIEKGATLNPDLIASLQRTPGHPQDARAGLMTGAIVTFFVGTGLGAMGFVLSYSQGDTGAMRGLGAVMALMWCIAAGLFVARLAIRPSADK
ncbi:MAG TPA: hypothetical protein VG387_04950 [Rhizomicrobium sp.]|jgi:hypothetical protein|nr:hypothetical protein [Rhizomicrobium sp.]